MTEIFLEDVTKCFPINGAALPVLDGVTVQVDKGEFVSLIGPSGCGKSTLFNIICGLTAPDQGRVLLGGQDEVSAGEVVAYMPQKDLLLPWRNVLDNVILARRAVGRERTAVQNEARELMHLFGLAGFENSYPAELSGGMRQRAALMRTVLARRRVLLLDEPLGALDAITRTHMQHWLLKVWNNFKQAIFLVTHDIDEAVFLSDRVYVLTPRPGKVCLHLPVNLPRPRSTKLLTDPAFLTLKKEIMRALQVQE